MSAFPSSDQASSVAESSSELEFNPPTPVPLRRNRSPENTANDVELSPKRLLRAHFRHKLNGPRAESHRPLDAGADAGSDKTWAERLLQVPINFYTSDGFSDSDEHMPMSAWQIVSELATRAVVTVRFCQAVPFDTTGAVATEASGFVVDKVRGIILTNRHVACAGPFVGEAVFENREQVSVHTIYRDPIHDFGFLKYSPEDVKYHDVHEIELDPSMARVGTEIRIIGNDSGEELSILAGHISKVDRNVPDFGPMAYNDFNTFYLQAASSSSGGSSGSPVIDIRGNAIGMQTAGRNQSATDFFMPLDRVKRALQLIQEGKTVERGDIQVQFLFKPFDYTRRIGLSAATEAKIRAYKKSEVGMLVAETVLPDGPGYRAGMIAGDILVSIGDQIVTGFVQFNEILDGSIGKTLPVVVERDGQEIELQVSVEDLDRITPDKYLSFGGAVVHDISYQLARYYCVPICGVFVSQPYGMLPLEDAGEGVLIRSVDGHLTPTLDDFIRVVCQLPDRARFPVVYYSLNDINEVYVYVAENERHWTDMDLFTRNDHTGIWDRYTIEPPPSMPSDVGATNAGDQLSISENTVQFTVSSKPAVQRIIPSLVQVHFYIPWMINAFPVSRRTGTGLIVDAERGLVAVSRSIVPFELGDLSITVAESLTVPARVAYLHPTLNFAIVQYDSWRLGNTPVKSARLSGKRVTDGDQLLLHAYVDKKGLCSVKALVSLVEPMSIPKHTPPRFRSINADWFKLDTRDVQKYNTGVLTDSSDGEVCGLWVSYIGDASDGEDSSEYFYGMDARLLLPVVEKLRSDAAPEICILGVEFTTLSLIEARHLGLDQTWVSRIREHTRAMRHRQLLMISRVACDSMCSGTLEPLDIVLEMNGSVVTQNEDFYGIYGMGSVKLTILRNMKVISVDVKTDQDFGTDTQRIVQWAGAIMHEPHLAVRQQCRKMPSKVYVSYSAYGSPAYAADLAPTSFITHVGEVATPDLDSFIIALRDLSASEDGFTYVRIVGIDMIPEVISLKLNSHYWPTIEIVRDRTVECGWDRIHHDS
ncbi:hypothetical protein LPJ53_000391 [Coemansia erecta]|uniref:Pro-apoptotic serine protease NMA111 n=1 Tax=Coemansia erecta TaxID=147472 RepID=A0A9W7Y232_9FUNG|nr:hypothetical protein LPJ53_000391 [Coemansia erecta]